MRPVSYLILMFNDIVFWVSDVPHSAGAKFLPVSRWRHIRPEEHQPLLTNMPCLVGQGQRMPLWLLFLCIPGWVTPLSPQFYMHLLVTFFFSCIKTIHVIVMSEPRSHYVSLWLCTNLLRFIMWSFNFQITAYFPYFNMLGSILWYLYIGNII